MKVQGIKMRKYAAGVREGRRIKICEGVRKEAIQILPHLQKKTNKSIFRAGMCCKF